MDDQDNRSIASDFSILPDANELESMSVAQPFLAAHSSLNSFSGCYNQVEFVNVCGNYPANQDLLLYYRFVENHTPVITDRLALYRVGFTSPEHYLVYEWAPRQSMAAPPAHLLEEGKPQSPVYAVTFRNASLPRDAAEFYQVCYVGEEQLIRGVSSPFQLMQDNDGASTFGGSIGGGGASNDLVGAVDQSDGSVLVTSDLSTLHSSIKMLQETVQQVRQEKESVEKQLTAVQTELQGKQEQLQQLEHAISELRVAASKERESSAEAIAAVVGKLQQAEQERNGLQDTLHQAREEVGRLQQETERQQMQEDKLTGLLAQREEELAKSEVQKQHLEAATNQLQALAQKQELLENELQQCSSQRDEARQQLQYWTDAASADKSVIHRLQDQCHSVNQDLLRQIDALQAEQERAERAEDEKTALVANLEKERAALTVLQEKLTTCQQELLVSEERRKVLDADNRALQNSLRALQTNTDELQDQLRESCSARGGAERVAEQLSTRQQDVERQLAAFEAKNKSLASKCCKLSKLILEQNVSESIEALVGLHDGDSTVDDEAASCVVNIRGGSHDSANTITPSSLAAMELSSSVDSQMNSMLSELLVHVKQLKTMMADRPVAQATDAPPAQLEENEKQISSEEETVQSVVAASGGDEERAANESIEKDLSTSETTMDELMSRAVEACRIMGECQEREEAIAEATAVEVLQEEEAEVFVDAPTRPSSTVINIESVPLEQAVEQTVVEQQAFQEQVEPQPDQAIQQQEEKSETKREELFEKQEEHCPPHSVAGPSSYYGPVFTSGQTAPVFFPQSSSCPASAMGTGNPSLASNSAEAGSSSFPQFLPHPYATPFPMPYPYSMPLPAGGFHAFPAPPINPIAPVLRAGLPPPLLPEVTDGARHAALLSTISAAAAQAIQNITSGLTPPAPEADNSVPSSGPTSAADNSTSEDETTKSTTSSNTKSGCASNGGANEAGASGSGYHYDKDSMRWQFVKTDKSTVDPNAILFKKIVEEQERYVRQQDFGNVTPTDLMGRMNHARERFQEGRQMQHNACRMAQQAAQAEMRQQREQRIQRLNHIMRLRQQKRLLIGNVATAAAAVSSAVATSASSAATVVSTAATVVSTAAATVSSAAATISSAAATISSAGATVSSATTVAATPASSVDSSAGAEQSHQLYEEDVEGDATQPQQKVTTGEQQCSHETVRSRRSQDADDGFLHCPMCHLKFGRKSSGLLQEHMDSHLEYICPVCNTAFQRAQEEAFTAHVNAHFADEEDHRRPSAPEEEGDPSGPWDNFTSRFRGFMETD